MAISGRFEWLSIPSRDESFQESKGAAASFVAKTCPGCGWIDGDRRFENIGAENGTRECWRCGMRWDLSVEISRFFNDEQITPTPVQVAAERANLKRYFRCRSDNPRFFDLYLQAEHLTLQKGFDRLLCMRAVSNITQLRHQAKAAMTALKKMRGRALLADEVGLGKTIEAGILIKELLMRGIANHILILVPAGLCYQWQAELHSKFDESFKVFSGLSLKKADARLIVSYDLAKRREALLNRQWDILILDEAHHLKSRNTVIYKYVKKLQSRYLLALTATPVQNSLDEMYSLIDLIKPGRLGTVRGFKRAFVSRSNPRKVKEGREPALKEILSEVMIRNRRDTCGLDFPCRRAGIYYVRPSSDEKSLYESVSAYVRKEYKKELLRETGLKSHMLSLLILQRELISTPAAVRQTLLRIVRRPHYPATTRRRLNQFVEMAEQIKLPSKICALREILEQFSGRLFVVFTEFVATAECLAKYVSSWSRPVFCLTGRHSIRQRALTIDKFARTDSSVLISTEAGGAGLNLQFCNHLVNFDLPWNPQRIEQRIGRIDRIGQQHADVYVFNLVCQDTVEEYVVNILAKKLRMFELVVGEMNEVLGHMQKGKSFENLVSKIWLNSTSKRQIKIAFSELGIKVANVRSQYDQICRANSTLNKISNKP